MLFVSIQALLIAYTMFRLEAAKPEAGGGGGGWGGLHGSEEKKVTRVQHFIHTRLMDACMASPSCYTYAS